MKISLSYQIKDIYYTVQDKENASSLARRFFVAEEYIRKANRDTRFESGDVIYLEYIGTKTHIVMPCETLESLAKKYETSLERLKKINDITNVFVGQIVFV